MTASNLYIKNQRSLYGNIIFATLLRVRSSGASAELSGAECEGCGCSRRNSVSRRFAAFLSQSPGRGQGQAFFFLPSVFTIASGATIGSTSRRCGCTSTAHSD